ncbi:hypothetical protein KOM00_05685 [Geomonas sp. Red69]|uniref:Fibronectin type-III domain-containing protein n=1 Tax=Geomonas diazotrophica TaxID=2843197 RepID=A0ABX8JHI2_9BACT|nr:MULTISPECIES: hypothetical protein [Geomonas]MBU5636219.1 hypothetical protein [Geomonas diazotrophica]QWV96114.1 hypothetical protein KP005_12055 [Geomonas nitrogeniifigens]QXE85181.1 hypothetical protein KP003_12335 [Geomonas nitrogeniifigens]
MQTVLAPQYGSSPQETAEMLRTVKVMLLNHDHPNLKPWPPWLRSIEGLGEDADFLEAAIARAQNHDVAMVKERDEFHELAKKRMARIGKYVELAVESDRNALQRAGFKVRPLQVKKTVTGPPPSPEFTVSHGKESGILLGKIIRYPGAKSYRVQITDQDPTTNPTWIDVDDFPLASKISIPGREPGKLYWIRASILSSNGRGPWCLPVCIRSL